MSELFGQLRFALFMNVPKIVVSIARPANKSLGRRCTLSILIQPVVIISKILPWLALVVTRVRRKQHNLVIPIQVTLYHYFTRVSSYGQNILFG